MIHAIMSKSQLEHTGLDQPNIPMGWIIQKSNTSGTYSILGLNIFYNFNCVAFPLFLIIFYTPIPSTNELNYYWKNNVNDIKNILRP